MRMILVLTVLLAAMPAAADDMMTVKESNAPVRQTVDRLAAALAAQGIAVVARVDHAANARSVGQELRPTELIVFGNPRIGTPLMQANPRAGIDLPLKVLAWEDAAGKVWVGYTRPEALQQRYGLAGSEAVIKTMNGALSGLTDKAAKGP